MIDNTGPDDKVNVEVNNLRFTNNTVIDCKGIIAFRWLFGNTGTYWTYIIGNKITGSHFSTTHALFEISNCSYIEIHDNTFEGNVDEAKRGIG